LSFQDFLDVVWGLTLIVLAIKFAPVVGIFAAISFGLAGLRIATLPIDRRVNA